MVPEIAIAILVPRASPNSDLPDFILQATSWESFLFSLGNSTQRPQHEMTFSMFESLSPPFTAADRQAVH
jgi:hypothetical protein